MACLPKIWCQFHFFAPPRKWTRRKIGPRRENWILWVSQQEITLGRSLHKKLHWAASERSSLLVLGLRLKEVVLFKVLRLLIHTVWCFYFARGHILATSLSEMQCICANKIRQKHTLTWNRLFKPSLAFNCNSKSPYPAVSEKAWVWKPSFAISLAASCPLPL